MKRLEKGALVEFDECLAISNVTGRVNAIIKDGCPMFPSVKIASQERSPKFSVRVSDLSNEREYLVVT